MEQGDVDWSYWRQCEPRWTLSREERQWLGGTGDAAVARGFGFILAVLIGGGMVALGLNSAVLSHDPTGYLHLAVGMAFLVLGGFVIRGRRWASIGLMLLYTADRGYGNLIAYLDHSPNYRNHLVFWLCSGGLAWAAWMRVFYVAYRAEGRAGMGLASPSDTLASRGQ